MLEAEGERQFSGRWWSYMQVDVSESADAVDFTVRVYWHTQSWRFAISYVNVWVTGTGILNEGLNDQLVNEATSGTYDHLMYTARATVQKGSSPQAISFTGALNNRSGYGNGRSEAALTYTVPARAGASYTVSYNANGGSGAPASQTKTQGVALTLSPSAPSRDGYAFSGWATSPGGGAAYYPGGSYTADASVTLYAVWTTQSGDAPGVSTAAAYRTSSYSSTAESPSGPYVYATFTWSAARSVTGVTIQYRRSGTTSWSTATSYGTKTGTSGTTYCHFSASTSYGWEVRVSVTNSAGTTTVAKAVGEGSSGVIVDVQGRGAGLGLMTSAPTAGVNLGGPRTYMLSSYFNFAGTDFTPAQIKAALGGSGGGNANSVFVGSKTFSAPRDTSVRVWTSSQFSSAFGRSFDPTRDSVAFMNGDGGASPAHLEGATYDGGGVYAVFDRTVNTMVRVNYVVVLAE